jgi:long-chain acyl-CoA synthetase
MASRNGETAKGEDRVLRVYEAYAKKPWVRFYDEGVEAEIEIPEIPLYKFLQDAASYKGPAPGGAGKAPGAVMIIAKGLEYWFGWREIYNMARRFASFLKRLGIGKGDTVALYLPNSPQFIVAYYGALIAGATVSPMSILYSPREIIGHIDKSGAKILVAFNFEDYGERVKKALDTARDKLKAVVWTGLKDSMRSGLARFLFSMKYRNAEVKVKEDNFNYKWEKIIKKYRPLPEDEFARINPKEDVAALMFTGGTTGIPKGVELTHYNLVANVYQIDAWYKRGSKGVDVFVGALPWFHIYGQTAVMNASIFRIATLLIFPRFDVDTIMHAIEKYKANLFHGVPLMYQMILKSYREGRRYNLTSLEACISGAAPLPMAVAEEFEAITGAKLREGYGLTEASPVTHVNPILGEARRGSIGLPLPNTIAAVADPENPELLEPGVVGELVVSGPQVMKGYRGMEEENRRVFFDCCGRRWLRTGDMAYMDEDGYFYIVDRKKDMIKYKGYSVFPREIEEVLYRHECVAEAAVIGVPHEEYTEVPKAFIVLRDECKNRPLDEVREDILKHLKENLAFYKIPKEIEFRDTLPKSAVGKILRRVLREEELRRLERRHSPSS